MEIILFCSLIGAACDKFASDQNKKIRNHTKVLVIILGNPRGGKTAWNSLHRHLIQPYKADLATFFPTSENHTWLQETSVFEWTVPSLSSWDTVFNSAENLCSLGDERKWTQLCAFPSFAFGSMGCNMTG
jgi:hypothetical protein